MGREGVEPSWSRLQRILSPQRLPFRHRPQLQERLMTSHAISLSRKATVGIEPTIGILQTPALTTWPRRPMYALYSSRKKSEAEDGIRTRDPLLGKEMLYR